MQAEVSLTNSQESGKSPQQQNTDFSHLTDTELCQRFVNLHCSGQKDAAKPFLKAFVARHQESTTPGDNRAFFGALKKLAERGANRG